ncbi:MAG TPA: class I SAM-dependent methyltransferase, partial [Thermomicrobiales bacterium]|nr:class I SAM-dependent methyltransferase [Thermomicrobiales bacterium]
MADELNASGGRRPKHGDVWKDGSLVTTFLEGVRGGIPFAAEQLDVMVRLLSARDAPVRSFLDLGSGAGTVAASVLSAYPDARAVLVDFSPGMLAEARSRFGDDRHTLVQADLDDACWADAV